MHDNGINIRQNRELNIQRLASQKQIYTDAKKLFYIKFVLSVILGVVLFVINLFQPSNELTCNILFLLKVIVMFIPLISFDKWINRKKELAARIQNEFDCEVLKIKCSNEVKSVSNIKVSKYYLKYRKNREKKYENESWNEKIINWYSEGYSKIPINKGRIHCQSMNIYYDKDLRDEFNKIMYWIIIGISFVSIINCLIFNWQFRKSIIHFFFPVTPIIVFLIQSIRNNYETSKILRNLKMHIDEVLDLVEKEDVDNEKLVTQSNEIQKELFEFRKEAFLIPDKFYDYKRKKAEEQHTIASNMVKSEYGVGE